jgi:hypothetical protein
MASKIQLKIYLGKVGHVESGPNNIILQMFRILTSNIDKLEDQTFWFIYQ